MPVADVIRQMGITEQTFYRWKRQYAGMQSDQVREYRAGSVITPLKGRAHVWYAIRTYVSGPYRPSSLMNASCGYRLSETTCEDRTLTLNRRDRLIFNYLSRSWNAFPPGKPLFAAWLFGPYSAIFAPKRFKSGDESRIAFHNIVHRVRVQLSVQEFCEQLHIFIFGDVN
jgi:hypothetical protein